MVALSVSFFFTSETLIILQNEGKERILGVPIWWCAQSNRKMGLDVVMMVATFLEEQLQYHVIYVDTFIWYEDRFFT